MRASGIAVTALVVVALAACSLPRGDDTLTGEPTVDAATGTPSDAPSAVTAEASEAATEAGELKLAFADSFSSPTTAWPIGKSGKGDLVAETRIVGGTYVGTMTVGPRAKYGSSRMLAPETLSGYQDVEVSAKIRKAGVSGGVGILCFQRVDTREGYEFSYDSDGWVGIIEHSDDGGGRMLAEDRVDDVIRPRGGNLLVARCTASSRRTDLTLFINGREVLRIADGDEPLYRQGQAGLAMGTNRRGKLVAVFDDFHVRGLPLDEEPAPPPTAPPTEQPTGDAPLISDAFYDEFSGWDVVAPGQGVAGEIMEYRAGAYEMRVRPPNTGFVSIAPLDRDPPTDDVAVQVRLRIDDGKGAAGVVCRGSDDQTQGYLAAIDERGGYSILRVGGNAPRPLSEPGAADPAVNKGGRWNNVRLECLGTADDATLRLFVNDELVAEVVDPEPLDSGSDVGLFVTPATRRGRLDARFDDFEARTHAPTA